MMSGTQRRWLLSALVVLGLMGLFFMAGRSGLPANAQAQLQTGSESAILVVPVQLERDTYGIAMVDTVGQTLWIYEINSRGPAHSRLRLLAARSWQYDRLLKQYNTDEPKPQQIKMLLENLGRKPDAEINILELAEPNNTNSSSQ